MPETSVETTQSGGGGSIYYHEGTRTISFDWEFAASPALVLICGPTADVWDRMHVWAAGRQEEIYNLVAEEVVRQKAPGYRYFVDTAGGTITIAPKPTKKAEEEPPASKRKARAPRDQHSAACKRFMASVPPGFEAWRDDQAYDVAAIPQMTAAERKEILAMLQGRDVTWREVVAFAAIPTAEARQALQAALQHHLSIDVRLAAADALDRQGSMENLEAFLAKQIRLLHNPREGLGRALVMAERHPSETIKQALLWASYNQTECAPHCARLLIKQTGAATESTGAPVDEMLSHLGLHNSSFTRQAAFEKLSKLVGMTLDNSAAD